MYAHGQVFDATPDEGEPRMVEIGNNAQEAVARDTASAAKDGRPRRYFLSREEYDAVQADLKPRRGSKKGDE